MFLITEYIKTGNATILEEPAQECLVPEHQSCILSPEVSPSQTTKRKYFCFMTAEPKPKIISLIIYFILLIRVYFILIYIREKGNKGRYWH